MKKNTIRSLLFIAGGGLAGFLIYRLGGCESGCVIRSSPLLSVAYMGLVGWLVGGIFKKENDKECNT